MEEDINVNETVVDTTMPEEVKIEPKGVKQRFMAATEKIGMTQNQKIAKGFVWGAIIGVLGTLAFLWAKKKGYINLGK